MKKLHYDISIDAPAAIVWDTMLNHTSYRAWTAVFFEGSHYEGEWEKGASMKFLTPDGSGMLSVIDDIRKHRYISIRHIGMVTDGVEDTTSEAVKAWAPAFENYTFTERDGVTTLAVDMDSDPSYVDYFNETWPPALGKLKDLCEA